MLAVNSDYFTTALETFVNFSLALKYFYVIDSLLFIQKYTIHTIFFFLFESIEYFCLK